MEGSIASSEVYYNSKLNMVGGNTICCLAVISILGLTTLHLYTKVDSVVMETNDNSEEYLGDRMYPFPLLQYPLHMKNASDFVDGLMTGRLYNPPEINGDFKQIKFTKRSRLTCGEDLDILILVKSVVFNKEDRDAHRSTWANLRYLAKFSENIQVVFLVGIPEEKSDQIRLQKEMKLYHDLVQGEYLDDNVDTTVKSLVGLNWAHKFCKKFKFVVFLKSDTYFSLDNLIKFLRDPHFYPTKRKRSVLMINTNPLPWENLSQTDLIAGSVSEFGHTLPGRSEEDGDPFLLNPEEYPLEFFPAFVFSPLQILSQKTAAEFYLLAPFVKYLHLEEIYLGILSNKLAIRPLSTTYVQDRQFDFIKQTRGSLDEFKNHICLYNILVEERRKLWYHFNPIL